MLKKIINTATLLLCMCLFLTACKGAGDKDKNTASVPESSTAASSTDSNDDSGKFKLTKATKYTSFENGRNVICCFGDSLTYGWGSNDGYNYPDQLESNLKGQYKVYNAGVCGEKGDAIMSRANGFDFELTNDVVFPAGSDRVALDRELFTATGAEVPIQYLGFGKDLPHDKVVIGGGTYDLLNSKGEAYQHDVYTLVRKGDTTSSLTLKKGTKVRYDYSNHFDKCEVAIINFGANDGDSGSDALIEKYKKFAQKYDKYLILVPIGNDESEAKFKKEFGKNAIVMREYFITDALKDYGESAEGEGALEKMNAYCLRKNMVPASFRLEHNRFEVHFSPLGNKVIADLVYKRGVELGYWK